MVQTAQGDDSVDPQSPKQHMRDRYGAAVKRCLLGATLNEDLADDLYQEFGVRFLTGKYDSADATRGREQFAGLLVDEVQQSLETDDVERIVDEFRDLNLYSYCKPALERRGA